MHRVLQDGLQDAMQRWQQQWSELLFWLIVIFAQLIDLIVVVEGIAWNGGGAANQCQKHNDRSTTRTPTCTCKMDASYPMHQQPHVPTYCQVHVDVIGREVVPLLDGLDDHPQPCFHLRWHSVGFELPVQGLEEAHRLLEPQGCLMTWHNQLDMREEDRRQRLVYSGPRPLAGAACDAC